MDVDQKEIQYFRLGIIGKRDTRKGGMTIFSYLVKEGEHK